MGTQSDRFYGISETSKMTGVPAYALRQWESRYRQLNPKRNGANHRVYSDEDIEVIRRIKELIKHERLTTKGASRKLSQELYGHTVPQTKKKVLDLIDKIQREARSALEILDASA